MKSTKLTSAQTPEELRDHLRTLLTEAEKMIGEAPDELRDGKIEALREHLEAAHERIAELYAEAKERVNSGARSADEVIRTRPYEAISIALGAGLVAGVLLGRQCRCR
jgi:ElaB/YqjD/DUF883 family membrane-anchored ribosome-binding protein